MEKSGGRDSEKRKSKVEIITDFIKLNDEIPVRVATTVDDLQVLKLQISDSMSAYFTSVVQHLKELVAINKILSSKHWTLGKSVALKTQPEILLMRMSSLKSG